MAKRSPVQSMSPDPEVGDDGGKAGSIMKDLAGPAALIGAASLYGVSSAKEREERSKKFRGERESRAAARENMKKYGMKTGGSVKSASSRADGIAQRGKTKGRVL
jgi:hypothetical protein